MYSPLMLNYLTTYIAKDVVFFTITTISTSIMSIQNINRFIVDHKDSDYKIFHKSLERTDLINKLHITNILIKDIIKSHIINEDDKDKIDMIFKNNVDDTTIVTEDEFNIVSSNISNVELPEPIKASIVGTLEIINKINTILDLIHTKIISYNNTYFNIYKLNIGNEINQVIHYNEIFDKRLDLTIKIIDIYKNKI